jgi:hypothetical protein
VSSAGMQQSTRSAPSAAIPHSPPPCLCAQHLRSMYYRNLQQSCVRVLQCVTGAILPHGVSRFVPTLMSHDPPTPGQGW